MQTEPKLRLVNRDLSAKIREILPVAVLPTPTGSSACQEATSVNTSIPPRGETNTCSVEGCQREIRARGVCIKHYGQMRRDGELELVQPRRQDDLCAMCGVNKAMLPRSSYCRSCASAYERERRRPMAAEINARRRAAYSPEKRWAETLKLYSMTPESYAAMLEAQGGVCAICKEPGDLHVDHDHGCCPGRKSCGECVRGLLCSNCNNGLGRFKDDAARLLVAATYLNGGVKWLEVLGYDRLPPFDLQTFKEPTLQELGCGGTDADDDPRRRE